MKAIILFCLLSIAPQDCDKTNAQRWESVPGTYELPFVCHYQAQIYAAEHNLAPLSGEYPKVRCSRHEFGARVG